MQIEREDKTELWGFPDRIEKEVSVEKTKKRSGR